jgi:hypothetical protein
VNPEEPLDITGMLAAWSQGDDKALKDVMPLVYSDLRLMARRHLGRLPTPIVQSGSLGARGIPQADSGARNSMQQPAPTSWLYAPK